MYHGFTSTPRKDDPENLFVEVSAFDTQLDHLLNHGWTPLNLDDYLIARDGGKCPRKSFLVTIDDGLTSVATLAAPVLTARSVPAVLFVPVGLIGKTAAWLPQPPEEPILDAGALCQLIELHDIELGGHGLEHTSMVALDSVELRRQTLEVRNRLTAMTGREARAFAYPFGLYDERAAEAVREAGFELAFSVFAEEFGRFAISRVDVNSTDTVSSLRLKLIPSYRVLWRALGRVRPLRRALRELTTRKGTGRPSASA